jgi:hypothetical protein
MKSTIIIIIPFKCLLIAYNIGDINSIIGEGSYILTNAFKNVTHLIHNVFYNGYHIDIPKFKEGININKLSLLDLNNKSNNINMWDKILKNPRTLHISSKNIYLYNIPFLGVMLALLNIFINSSLGLGEKVKGDSKSLSRVYLDHLIKYLITFVCFVFKPLKKFLFKKKYLKKGLYKKKYLNKKKSLKKKNYLDKLWNNWYIDSIRNFTRNFSVFMNNSTENDQENNNLPANNNAGNNQQNNNLPANNNAENNQQNIIWRLEDEDYVQLDRNINSRTFLELFRNQQQGVQQDLINTNLRTLVGTGINITWEQTGPRSSDNILPNFNLIAETRMLGSTVLYPDGRLDLFYGRHYEIIANEYEGENSFSFSVNYGDSSELLNNHNAVGNRLEFIIHDFHVNFRAIEHFIFFLEYEIHLMQQARSHLINGNLNAEIYTYNGIEGQHWVIHDFYHYLTLLPDFDIQLSRRLTILGYLRSILLHMESINNNQ